MDTLTFFLTQPNNVVTVALNGINLRVKFTLSALADLNSLHNVDGVIELANLLYYEVYYLNSTLTELEIKAQIISEFKRLDILF